MTVNELASALSLNPLAVPDGEREITGGYTGDLLSWVMGRARAGQAWITIMSNINIVAVAALADVSCIILAEGILPPEEVQRTAQEKGCQSLLRRRDRIPAFCGTVRVAEMSRFYYDFHIHSCLSPCGDAEMTPANIAGMASLAGLQLIALTDHNSARNCPAFFAAAEKYGIIPVAGLSLIPICRCRRRNRGSSRWSPDQ